MPVDIEIEASVAAPASWVADFGGSVLEIRDGPAPAIYSGVPTCPATDCPVWGDLTLDEEISVPAAGLVPPDGTEVVDAWRGTMTGWRHLGKLLEPWCWSGWTNVEPQRGDD
jgi:hypothetical protein